MAVIENDYAAYIQTPQGEYPLRDIGAVRTDQGTENAGKVLGIGSDGNVTPVSSPLDDSAPPIIETYNGQTIQSSMSADRPLKGLNLYATCKQQTYSGKNLFNKETIEDGVVNASGQLDSSETDKTSDFIKVKPSTQYKSSFNSAYVKFYTSEKEPVQTESVDVTTNTQSFTTGESTEYIRYSFNFAAQTPETLIIVEGTNELTPYEPYTGGNPSPNGDYPQEIQTISDFTVEVKNSMGAATTLQTLNIVIPEQGFYGIPVSEGGNYTDTDGQQWYADCFNYKTKKFVKCIEKTTAIGEKVHGTAIVSGFGFASRIATVNTSVTYGMCEKLSRSNTWNVQKEVFSFVQATGNTGMYSIIATLSHKTLGTTEKTTINDASSAFKTYLSSNPLTFFYVLKTAIEYDLTDEQVEQFKKLKSYYGTTYIDNDAVPVCNMQAELVLDTKLYIDNKFTTLAGQIIEDSAFGMGGNADDNLDGGINKPYDS